MRPSTFLAAALLTAASPWGPAHAAPVYQYTTIDVPGAVETHAHGIDDSGRIVGTWRDAAGTWRGFVAAGGTVTTVAYPGAAYTDAVGIGPGGAIVGSASPSAQPAGSDFVQGYVLNGGGFTPLAVAGATATAAFGINGSGVIVGGYIVDSGGVRRHHGAVWSGGVMSTLDIAGADDTVANGINEAGQIVGGYGTQCAGCGSAGFLWSAGTVTPIVPFGAARSGAYGLDDAGRVVGWYGEGDDLSGYLWDGLAFHMIEPPSARFAEASDIDNAGRIVGSYADAAGVVHGFLAVPQDVPVPAPGAASLTALALAVAALSRRRPGGPSPAGSARVARVCARFAGQARAAARRLAPGWRGARSRAAAALAALALGAPLALRAAPVLDYGYTGYIALDAGQSHWFTNVQRTGSETGSGVVQNAVADDHLGGAQAALTSAYVEVGAMGGRVRASTGGALLASAQGFDDLHWFTDFLVTGTPGTQVSFLFGTALDGLLAHGGLPHGTYSGAVSSTTHVGGQLLASWTYDVLIDPGPLEAWAIQAMSFDVGSVVRLSSRLTVGAHADIESSVEADAFNTARFFVDVLTPGGGYLTGGGVVFPNLPGTPVPEPATSWLLGIALLAALRPWRMRRRAGGPGAATAAPAPSPNAPAA